MKITLVRSVICTLPKQRKTIKALGLTKINQTKIMPDNNAIRGMIKVVNHLVKVEEV
ncbi:MAG: 50S ribosomal protein L30 [Firmicutes bacterium]|nr:50S ribosomal protein L30 [Bacillota bacterium]